MFNDVLVFFNPRRCARKADLTFDSFVSFLGEIGGSSTRTHGTYMAGNGGADSGLSFGSRHLFLSCFFFLGPGWRSPLELASGTRCSGI